MTSNLWFLKGIKKGVLTEKFPAEPPEEPPPKAFCHGGGRIFRMSRGGHRCRGKVDSREVHFLQKVRTAFHANRKSGSL